jgi:hypothetical protein
MPTDPPALALTVDGVETIVRFQDFTALEARDFRREMGVGLISAFTDSPDLDTLAGVLWLKRRQTDPKVTFETVAGGLTYLNFDADFASTTADPAGEVADPEA